ncbi:MAG TPA: hypothetical protein VMH27_10020 [Puia sp.]|nr:hypothetical protein [Puia sp.]
MKKKIVLPLTGMLLAALLGAGCQKAVVYEENHPGVYNVCRVAGFNLGPNGAGQVVTYNQAGNPVSVLAITPPINGAGVNLYFNYDDHNRVRDYQIIYYQGTTPVVWHRYTYPRPHIAIDSEYAYDTGPRTAPYPELSSFQGLSVDSFDDEGRILRQGNGPTDPVFVYDERGNNTADPNFRTFDDKINPYRTNYTWMFVFHSFNTNNPLADSIASYDQYGLPTAFRSKNIYDYFGLIYGESFTVTYSCDLAPQAGL